MSYCSCGNANIRWFKGRRVPMGCTCSGIGSQVSYGLSKSADSTCYLTLCPKKCGARVFFIRHNGGSVWIDPPLGSPWYKHGCMHPENVKAGRRSAMASHLPQGISFDSTPSVPMTMRHRPPGSLPLRVSGETSTWSCPARHPPRPLPPVALKTRKAVGRRWFQRHRRRRLNWWTGHAGGGHSQRPTRFGF